MKVASPLVLVSALMFSIPSVAQPKLPVNCKGGANNCKVVITMSAGCGSGIKVAPDPIVVEEANVNIVWVVQAPFWSFEDGGIFIHQANDAFAAPKKESSTMVLVLNKGNRKGAFKYDITLRDTRPNGGVCKLDPTIVNQ